MIEHFYLLIIMPVPAYTIVAANSYSHQNIAPQLKLSGKLYSGDR